MVERLFLSHQLQRTVTTAITSLCHLTVKAPEGTQQRFSHDPAIVHSSLTQLYSSQLSSRFLESQCAVTDFVGKIEISLPSDKLLESIVILNF